MSRMLSSYGQVRARALTGGALIGLLATTVAARAQEGPDAQAPAGLERAQEAPEDKAPGAGDIVVTAQRMEEKILDVPISISAFSAKDLSALKIEGGSELLRAIPNVNFSKDNFTGYNFAIRGIGTKATSVSADPAVAISFNNTTLLRNRLFEQEYFDIERLEVLRGPQGTLYGRNATAGVVNMIPNKPKLGKFNGELQGELGNYNSKRARGFINIPLGDNVAIRAAGAWTKRSGFDYNTVTDRAVNGRDLWSTRLSALWEPSSNFRVNVFWEHFNEDDNRSRTGKQLCTRAKTPGTFKYPKGYTDGDAPNDPDPNIDPNSFPLYDVWAASTLTPGCQNKSLFTNESNGVPNGLGFPIVTGMLLVRPWQFKPGVPNRLGPYGGLLANPVLDPFAVVGDRQSSDLRQISTTYDPVFRAKNDVVQLNVEFDPTNDLHLFSQTLYMKDNYFGSQDFFRFDAKPIFAPRESFSGIKPSFDPFLGPSTAAGNGVFCDPQLGCSDRPLAVDVSRSSSEQWSQEFRLQSSFNGPLNFNVGLNAVKFKTREEYNVYSNLLTVIALGVNSNAPVNCDAAGRETLPQCIYIDPNPIGKGPQDGHNYLRSINIAKIRSLAAFGELYWKATDNLKFTAGLRYTDDQKTLTPVPTQLLASATAFGGGYIGRGYPEDPDQVQQWKRFTGRLAVDWKPDLSFTDSTLLYASYSRGYKAGGANPRSNATNPLFANYTTLPDSFKPEDVNAFEIGTKNQLAGGKVVFSAAAFYNDYKGYQISQLIDRAFHTENVDAKTMGLEFEGAWIPSRHFRLGATLGYLKTKIGKGQYSIDVMDRLQGHDDWVTLRPWAQSPNTCVAPKEVVARLLNSSLYTDGNSGPPPGWKPGDPPIFGDGVGIFMRLLCESPNFIDGRFNPGSDYSSQANLVYNPTAPYDPSKPTSYDPANPFNYGGPNGGRGFAANLSGHELPNAPHLTFNVGAQYTFFMGDWQLAVRGDYYRQSSSFARIYNTDYDKLRGWGNGNLGITLTRPKSDLAVQFYIKNILNSTPITDAYTGPDELGNFTNVFTLDPRIYGLSLKKGF
ncbi:MAG: TonB-dependent receptor [Pseudomonadota bacterium]